MEEKIPYPPEAWSLLIASWINLILYATEFLLCVYYFIESSQRKTKWFMIFSLFVDSLGTAMVCCNVYYPLVVYKTISFEPFLKWAMPITVGSTFVSAMLEQGYFAYRYWAISRNRTVTIFMVVIILALPAFSVASSVALSIIGSVKSIELGRKSVIVSCVLATTTDIFLAVVTVWNLRNIRTVYDTTKNLVRRVSTYATVYGVTTAAATMLMLCLFFVSPDGYIIVFFCLGRIYSLTVFLNLILLREWGITSPSNSVTASTQCNPLNQIDFRNLDHGDSTIKQTHELSESRKSIVEPYMRPTPAPAFSMDSI